MFEGKAEVVCPSMHDSTNSFRVRFKSDDGDEKIVTRNIAPEAQKDPEAYAADLTAAIHLNPTVVPFPGSQKGVTHPRGFGTKADLCDKGGQFLIDFKTCDGDADKLEGKRTYDNHHMQLAATRAALESSEWGWPDDGQRTDGPRRQCYIVWISRTHPGVVTATQVDESKLVQGWTMFNALLTYWQAANKYKPTWAC